METKNKIRDVLKEMTEFLELWNDEINPLAVDDGESLIFKAKDALEEPVRNCEVGTAEEQAHRFHDFCVDHQSQIHGMCSPYCPCIGSADMCHCLTRWAQMPCEKGATDADK